MSASIDKSREKCYITKHFISIIIKNKKYWACKKKKKVLERNYGSLYTTP